MNAAPDRTDRGPARTRDGGRTRGHRACVAEGPRLGRVELEPEGEITRRRARALPAHADHREGAWRCRCLRRDAERDRRRHVPEATATALREPPACAVGLQLGPAQRRREAPAERRQRAGRSAGLRRSRAAAPRSRAFAGAPNCAVGAMRSLRQLDSAAISIHPDPQDGGLMREKWTIPGAFAENLPTTNANGDPVASDRRRWGLISPSPRLFAPDPTCPA